MCSQLNGYILFLALLGAHGTAVWRGYAGFKTEPTGRCVFGGRGAWGRGLSPDCECGCGPAARPGVSAKALRHIRGCEWTLCHSRASRTAALALRGHPGPWTTATHLPSLPDTRTSSHAPAPRAHPSRTHTYRPSSAPSAPPTTTTCLPLLPPCTYALPMRMCRYALVGLLGAMGLAVLSGVKLSLLPGGAAAKAKAN